MPKRWPCADCDEELGVFIVLQLNWRKRIFLNFDLASPHAALLLDVQDEAERLGGCEEDTVGSKVPQQRLVLVRVGSFKIQDVGLMLDASTKLKFVLQGRVQHLAQLWERAHKPTWRIGNRHELQVWLVWCTGCRDSGCDTRKTLGWVFWTLPQHDN